MNSQPIDLRTIIKQIISENFNSLEEAQKGKQFDLYLEFAFSKITPDVPEGLPKGIDLKKEAYNVLSTKLNKVFQKDFDYKNFYIVKLGKFVLLTNNGKQVLSFTKEGVEDKKYSYTYLYIYKNTTELIRFGSLFFETDDLLIKAAQEHIIGKKINLVTQTEKGSIIVDSSFESDNVIDLVDYSQVKTPTKNTDNAKRPGASYVPKASYKVGDKILHRDFGQGQIIAVKKVPAQIPTFDVTAKFKQGERMVDKTIRMQKKMQGQVQ